MTSLLRSAVHGHRQLSRILREQLARGTQPQRLALAIAVGATLGMLPLIWGTWILCGLCAALLRLNQVLVQLAHALVYPLHLLLFVPYLKAAERLYADRLLPDSPLLLVHQLQTEPAAFFKQFWLLNLQAASIWLLTAPLMLLVVFGLALRSLKMFRSPGRSVV